MCECSRIYLSTERRRKRVITSLSPKLSSLNRSFSMGPISSSLSLVIQIHNISFILFELSACARCRDVQITMRRRNVYNNEKKSFIFFGESWKKKWVKLITERAVWCGCVCTQHSHTHSDTTHTAHVCGVMCIRE